MLQAKLGTRQEEFCVVPRAPIVTKDTFWGFDGAGSLAGSAQTSFSTCCHSASAVMEL